MAVAMSNRTRSDNAPVVQLGYPERRADRQARVLEKMPELAGYISGGDPDEVRGQVFATRTLAREIVAEHPEIDGPVLIDCMWAEVLSPTVVDELLNAWPKAEFFNCNEDAAESVAVVRKRREAGNVE